MPKHQPRPSPWQKDITAIEDKAASPKATAADCLTSLDAYIEDCGNTKINCPDQSAVGFWDQADGLYHLYRIVCKRWTCPYCGRIKRAQLTRRIELARPNRFLTLTTACHATETPRQVYDWTRRQISELGKVVRREHSEFEYLRCIEATKTGFPHYHLLVRSGWLDQHELSRLWCRLTQAFIVDIRTLTKDERAAKYVMKYLTKQGSVPFTKRRLSWTRNFFPRAAEPQREAHSPIEVGQWHGDLDHVAYWEFPEVKWEKINPWHWIRKGKT